MPSPDLSNLPPGAIAVPCTEAIYSRCAAEFMTAFRRLPAAFEIWVDWCQVPIIQKRSYLAKRLLDHPALQWLLFVDSDMLITEQTLATLIEDALQDGRDIVGARCFTRHAAPFRPAGGWFDKTVADGLRYVDSSEEGLIEVDWVGTGCIMIRRCVLEALARRRDPEGLFQAEPGYRKFGRGEDQEFCRAAKDAGFKVYYHGGVPVGHFGALNIDAGFVRYIEEGGAPPARASCHASIGGGSI